MTENTYLKVWASSHGCKHRHLPDALKSYLSNQSRFRVPIFDARGGRKFESSIVKKIAAEILIKSSSHQIHVLVLGSNILRGGQKPEDIMVHFSDLYHKVKHIDNLHVVAAGVFPST